MGIDVFFGGLMLICLSGQPECPVVGKLGNTAYVVKADGHSWTCGRSSTEKTKLILRFQKDQFFKAEGSLSKACNYTHVVDKVEVTDCELSNETVSPVGELEEYYPYPSLCVIPNSQDDFQQLDISLQQVARLAEIDRRFIRLNADSGHLNKWDWVPTRIQFPPGVVGAGPKWLKDNPIPTPWSRSDDRRDGTLPRALSDKVKVTYQEATEIKVTNCDGTSLIELVKKPFATNGVVGIVNYAKDSPKPDRIGDQYDELGYLRWYYRLGLWDTTDRECPGDTAVLRCVRLQDPNSLLHQNCAQHGDADNVHWPPLLGSSY